MNQDYKKIVDLAIDHARGRVTNFSADEAEHTLRQALNDLIGEEKNLHRALRKNGHAIFTIMEEALDVLITEGIEDQYADFVEYRNVNYGDKITFTVDDYHLFNVATIAAGNNALRRQRLDRQVFNIDTGYKAVKIYDELERFLAGKVDWAKMVAKVQRSFNAEIAKDINDAIVAGYTALNAPYKYSGTWDLGEFNALVQHIQAATGRDVMVVGTRASLQKMSPAYVAYNGQVVEDRNKNGFFKVIDGVTCYEIKQSHKPGTDTFAIDDYLLVLPVGDERIVKIILEGEAQVIQTTAQGENMDDSMEYLFKKKYGVGVLTSSKYGVMLLS
jgi:hypothetical protein